MIIKEQFGTICMFLLNYLKKYNNKNNDYYFIKPLIYLNN